MNTNLYSKPKEIEDWLEQNLLKVQKPGRYIGGEFNQVRKSWDRVNVHLALAFPDIYEIGVPNLGLTILYDIVNNLDHALAERVYSPWLDMESLMREAQIPLFSLESKTPIGQFDILGITLPYETVYTNALNLIDLAGLPIRATERDESHPLIIAGGHAASNPEPMADFIDVFAIGEGESLIVDICSVWMKWKQEEKSKASLLKDLSQVPGIYVPRYYTPRYFSSGLIERVETSESNVPMQVLKRIEPILPSPPIKPIVPSIDVVHNRVSIEIMRGCSRGCRFCHAGMVNRPVRERPMDEVLDAIQQTLEHTGYEEVALLSLSSSDYTQIAPLVNSLADRYKDEHLTISLPSLRIDSLSVDLLEKLKESRSSGFTLAPEAASEKMRNTINKPISSQNLLDVAREIYQRGWSSIKLYFMIGLPGETMEDVEEIPKLCKLVIQEGRRFHGKRTGLHVSVGTFIPKPHTPFQWRSMESLDSLKEKQLLLQHELRGPGIRLNWPGVNETLFEAWISRGDRRLSGVIYTAWKNNARFDAWHDQFNLEIWKNAFLECGLDPMFFSHRERDYDEILLWDHISMGVSKKYLTKQDHLARSAMTQADCSQTCNACGILPIFQPLRETTSGSKWKCPEIEFKENLLDD